MEETKFVFPLDSTPNEPYIRFLESGGELFKGYPLTFGLVDSNKTRYAITGDMWSISDDGVAVGRILFYAFSGEQLIDKPISHCFVRLNVKKINRAVLANVVMSFCYAVSKGALTQSFRDAVYEYKDVISWEKNDESNVTVVG